MIHLDKQSYTLPAGQLSDEGLQAIHRYLYSLRTGWNGTIPPLEQWVGELNIPPDASDIFWPIMQWLEANGFYQQMGWHIELPRYLAVDEHYKRNLPALLKRWHRALRERTPGISMIGDIDLSPLGYDWTISKGQYAGTFPKRLTRYLKAEYKVSLRPEHVETIGNIGSAHVSRQSDYVLTFDRGFLDGDSEDYGNPGSCWWGSYSGGRIALHENGGYAIRAWEGDRVVGRVWIAPYGDNWVLFNGYGYDTLTFARMLAHKHGLTYKLITLDGGDDGIYINSGRGVVLGEYAYDSLDLGWYAEPSRTCYYCECSMSEDEARSDPDGDYCCDDCYNDRFSDCYRCGEIFTHDDFLYCDGDYLCESCADGAGFARCDGCAEMNRYPTIVDSGENYCEGCLESEGFYHCESCDEYVTDCDCQTSNLEETTDA